MGKSPKAKKEKPQVVAVTTPQIEPNAPAIFTSFLVKKYTDNSYFKLKLILGDKEYTSEGPTAFDALKNLKKPAKIVSKGTLTISKGEQSHEVYLTIPRARRLFWSPSTQQILAKQYTTTLK